MDKRDLCCTIIASILGAAFTMGVTVRSCLTFILWFSVPSVALAQPAPPPPPNGPASIGTPHVCLDLYPQGALMVHAEGTTKMAFNITPQGTTTDITVIATSGNSDLDDASITCVKRWLYRPVTKDGQPVEVPWKANVMWKLNSGDSPPMVPKFAEPPRQCLSYYPVKAEQLAASNGWTGVLAHISDGAVTDATVAHPSGNDELDKYAIDCVKSWRFQSAEVDGHPVLFTSRFLVWWKFIAPH